MELNIFNSLMVDGGESTIARSTTLHHYTQVALRIINSDLEPEDWLSPSDVMDMIDYHYSFTGKSARQAGEIIKAWVMAQQLQHIDKITKKGERDDS